MVTSDKLNENTVADNTEAIALKKKSTKHKQNGPTCPLSHPDFSLHAHQRFLF